MARTLSTLSISIIKFLKTNPGRIEAIYTAFQEYPKKRIYDTVFRLQSQELLTYTDDGYTLTDHGQSEFNTISPEKDGVWKIIIFDIPETQRPVRNFIRAKLKSLGFKLWQNSIWISPYKLSKQIEEELNELAKHYFVRLIKTTEINHTTDLEKLFK